jgi:glycosylphosphatidylinositol transamidase (GPIT) subunit GPI8
VAAALLPLRASDDAAVRTLQIDENSYSHHNDYSVGVAVIDR